MVIILIIVIIIIVIIMVISASNMIIDHQNLEIPRSRWLERALIK